MHNESEIADPANAQTVTECCGGESHCSGDSPLAGAASVLGNREGCPPPLQWQQVVATFREQSEAWQAETPAGQIRGRVWGEGPPLLFLNGLGGSHELFALCVYLLKDQFRCVLLDYPSGQRTTWTVLSDSIAEVIEEFAGADGVRLFGTSVGAALALEAALRLKSCVRSIVLHAPFAHLHLTLFERIGASLLRWLPGRASSIPGWRGLQERSHRLWFPPIDPTRWQFYVDNAGQTPIGLLAQRFGMLKKCDLRSRLANFTTPTMLLHVEGEGAMQQRCREELTSLLPKSKTEFLHTTGLLVFLTHPHRLAKLIREFAAPA